MFYSIMLASTTQQWISTISAHVPSLLNFPPTSHRIPPCQLVIEYRV